MLAPFEHELDVTGTRCAADCPACQWARLQDHARETLFYRGSGLISECEDCGCIFDPLSASSFGTCPACPMIAQQSQTVAEFDAEFLESMCIDKRSWFGTSVQ
jgi:hypothetical protein